MIGLPGDSRIFMNLEPIDFRKGVEGLSLITCNWLGDSMETEPVSKQAFSKARNRLSYTAFEAIHANGIRVNYSM